MKNINNITLLDVLNEMTGNNAIICKEQHYDLLKDYLITNDIGILYEPNVDCFENIISDLYLRSIDCNKRLIININDLLKYDYKDNIYESINRIKGVNYLSKILNKVLWICIVKDVTTNPFTKKDTINFLQANESISGGSLLYMCSIILKVVEETPSMISVNIIKHPHLDCRLQWIFDNNFKEIRYSKEEN